jgi:phage shock protein C
MERTRRLLRSRTDRLISGVCGGVAQYFGFDSVIVRGGFVIVGLINPGVAAIVYLAAVFLIAEEPESGSANQEHAGWRFDPWTGDPIAHHTPPATTETSIVPHSEDVAEADAPADSDEALVDAAAKPRRARKKSSDTTSDSTDA